MSNLPAVGSAWGVVDDVRTWSKFCGVDDDRGYKWETWNGMFFDAALRIEPNEVDIRAIVSGGDSAMRELHAAIERGGLDISCCMDCGAPVVCIPDGLPMCEGCATKAMESGKGLPELTDAERERMNAMPASLVEKLWNKVVVPAIANTDNDTINHAERMQMSNMECPQCHRMGVVYDPRCRSFVCLFDNCSAAWTLHQQQQSDLSQPFTVDWLCEIGGRKVSDGREITVEFGGCFRYWTDSMYWTLRGVAVPKTAKITTRGDVLKWLDVLGIEVKPA